MSKSKPLPPTLPLTENTLVPIIDALIDQFSERWILCGTAKESCWFSLSEFIRNESAVFQRLTRIGLPVLGGPSKTRFKNEIEDYKKYRTGVAARMPGWTANRFVFGDHRVASSSGDSDPTVITFPKDIRFSASTSLENWRSGVKPFLKGQSVPMFGTCFALAAPLLEFAPEGLSLPQVELVGPPACGKTTLAVASSSVWCGDPSSDIGGCETWNITPGAMDPLRERYNGMLLVLDEANLVSGTSSQKRQQASQAIFRFSTGKARMRYNEVNPIVTKLALLSTSNEPQSKRLGANSNEAAAQASRLATIKLGAGLGIFSSIPAGFRSTDDAAKAFRQFVGSNYGVAGQAFVKRLVREAQDVAAIKQLIAYEMDHFRKIARASNTPVHNRIIETFALAYAAGRLAKRWDIFPTGCGNLSRHFLYVLGLAGQQVSGTPKARLLLRSYVERNYDNFYRSGTKPLTRTEFRGIAGVMRVENGDRLLYVSPTTLRKAVGNTRELMQHLRAINAAKTETGKQPKLQIKLPKQLCESGRAYCINLTKLGLRRAR